MRTLVGVLALSLCSHVALAGATVTISPSWAGTAVWSQQFEWFTVEITAPAGTVVSVVGSGDPVLTDVKVTASATGGAQFLDLSILGVGSVHKVRRSATNPVRLYLRNLSSSGTLRDIEATQIGDIVTDHNILGSISATGLAPAPGISPLPIHGDPGIRSIVSRLNYITANITVDHGSNIGTAIGGIHAPMQTIGTPSAPVTISARGPIGTISAGGVYASVNTFDTDLKFLKATGANGTSGDFVGAISARSLVAENLIKYAVEVKRDLDADITLTQPLAKGILVGRSFLAGRTISLPERGLAPGAQVTFNDANTSPAGEWLGSVAVGAITLAPVPNYNAFPRSLGPANSLDGGSVGLASFLFHGMGSFPIHGTTLNLARIDTTVMTEPPPCVVDPNPLAAKIRHYGPVELNTTVGSFSNDRVFEVLFTPLPGGSTDPSNDVTDEYRVFKSGSNTPTFSGENRVVEIRRIDGNPLPQGSYRVRLIADVNGITRLRSQISGNGAYIPGYTHSFSIISDCSVKARELFDVNNDGVVNADDIAAWLNEPSDLNEDNAVTGADLNRIVIGVATYGN